MSKKTVGLDARMWDHPGIGRYIRELSRELVICASHEELVFLGDPERIKKFFPPDRVSKSSVRCISARSPIYSLQEQWEIPRKSAFFDALHVPHFNIPVLFRGRLVATVHDLIYLYDAKASRSVFGKTYVEWLLKIIAKKAAAVICVSQYTKDQLLGRFKSLSPERTFVVYEAPSPVFRKIAENDSLQAVRRRLSLTKPFVLFVGTLKPHKNIPMLVQAFGILKQKYKLDHELVLVGHHDKRNVSVMTAILREHDFVRYIGSVEDETLAVLYNLAELFVLPSLYEGFGLPVIEAMACGIPVLVSNRTSLPEVVGSAGLLFDPTKVDALSELLYNALHDQELRKNLIFMGLEQAKKFSWRTAAEQTIQVYRQAMN